MSYDNDPKPKRARRAKRRQSSTADAVAAADPGKGVGGGKRHRVRDRAAPAVREVHDRPRADGTGRPSSDDQEDGAGDLRVVRGDRAAAGQVADAPGRASGFVDRNGKPLHRGDQVTFHSYKGTRMPAIVEADTNAGTMIHIRISTDPFPTFVDHEQLELVSSALTRRSPVATTTKPSARQLRQQARELGVPDWESMDSAALAKAVSAKTKPSTNGRAKPAKATKAVAKAKPVANAKPPARARAGARPATKAKDTTRAVRKPAPKPPAKREGPNPYRPGTNMWHLAEALMKGGKRSTLVQRLIPKLNYHPRKLKPADFDVYEQTDRRLKIVGYNLRDLYGFEYIHEGRGPSAMIKVVPPPKPVRLTKPPAKRATKATKARKATKATTKRTKRTKS